MAKIAGIDLAKLSLEELRGLSAAATERIAEMEEERRQEAFEKIQELAAEVGMEPKKLVARYGKRAAGKASGKLYRNPDNPEETWAGRGRKPGWVTAALDAGKTLEELAAAE